MKINQFSIIELLMTIVWIAVVGAVIWVYV